MQFCQFVLNEQVKMEWVRLIIKIKFCIFKNNDFFLNYFFTNLWDTEKDLYKINILLTWVMNKLQKENIFVKSAVLTENHFSIK